MGGQLLIVLKCIIWLMRQSQNSTHVDTNMEMLLLFQPKTHDTQTYTQYYYVAIVYACTMDFGMCYQVLKLACYYGVILW